MRVERPHYLAFMLRLWQPGGGEGRVWHASLESPGTGERQAFASLDALLAFLKACCAADEAPQPDETPAAASPAASTEHGMDDAPRAR